MDWNSNLRPFFPRPNTSFNFLYNFNYHDQYPGMEVKHPSAILAETEQGLVQAADKINYGIQEKKKRLTTDQLDLLEKSFQEEIKLDPDRKMKLSRELGLQPRQIAVWFQNRRARWKTKQLECLYHALRQEFDVVSKEKQKLQEEVMKLKAVLREQVTRNQASTGYTEISGEETVESTSVAANIRSPSNARRTSHHHHYHHQIAECNYLLTSVDENEYNPVSSPCWALLPTYP